ncbi:MAG: pyridoxal phosphate-dependent aminotransferase [Halolamina sp.]|uniref:pyridoxal phosphate-dependent aminotransferase n=1 Tax=Halolamina sp. TaxID=1940283 RepID=UPI002FC2F3C8
MFEPMPYLEWIHGRPAEATYNLGSSDLRTYRPGSEVVPEPLVGLEQPEDPPELAASIAAEYGVDESQVVVAAGATHANFLAVATALALAEGDKVVVEKPGYGPLVHTPAGLGGDIQRFRRPAEDRFELDPDRVTGVITDSTALVTVTNRHNPSGRLTSRDELAAVATAAQEAGSRLLVDEVYGPYVEEEGEGAFGGITAAGLRDVVVTSSLTKFHGLGGLEIGWLIAPESFTERARVVRSHVPAVAAPSRALARRFFAHKDELVAVSREHLRRNNELLSSFVAKRADLSGRIPDGCTFGFVRHERADGSELAEAAWDAGILVVPGRFFGIPEGIRLSAGRDTDEVRAGLEAFGELLDGL